MNKINIARQRPALIMAGLMLLMLAACGNAVTPESSPTTGRQVQPASGNEIRPTFTPLPTETVNEGTSTPGVGTPVAPTPIETATATESASLTPTSSAEPVVIADDDQTFATSEVGANELPKIYGFVISPREVEISGRVYMAWDARGDRAYICPRTYLGLIDHQCFNVPLVGSQYVTIHANDETWDYYGYELHVVADGIEVVEFLPITITCQGGGQWWFFRGDPYATHVPEQCPVSYPLMSEGAAQRFEHGMMMWIEATAQIIVFFEDGQYRSFSNLPAPSTDKPVDDTPPDGFFEPISGFGMLWHGEVPGNEDIRERLGWAVEQEFPTITAYQCYAEISELTCFVRGPQVEIIRLLPDGRWDIWPAK